MTLCDCYLVVYLRRLDRLGLHLLGYLQQLIQLLISQDMFLLCSKWIRLWAAFWRTVSHQKTRPANSLFPPVRLKKVMLFVERVGRKNSSSMDSGSNNCCVSHMNLQRFSLISTHFHCHWSLKMIFRWFHVLLNRSLSLSRKVFKLCPISHKNCRSI